MLILSSTFTIQRSATGLTGSKMISHHHSDSGPLQSVSQGQNSLSSSSRLSATIFTDANSKERARRRNVLLSAAWCMFQLIWYNSYKGGRDD